MSTEQEQHVIDLPEEYQDLLPGGDNDEMTTHDGHVLLTSDMRVMLNSMLLAEADKLGADDPEIAPNFKEEPFDEDEFMSHIVLEEEPMPIPDLIDDNEPVITAVVPAEPEPAKPQQKQGRKQVDDDGFITVGKKSNKKNNKDKTTNNNNKQNNKNQQPQKQQKREQTPSAPVSRRAEQAEIRPKMPGSSEFPFCFICATRHDFDDCKA